MPGPRLTDEDRERIAEWLSAGLGFAEIARRLGRPTSTISREVARNGTHGTYLAQRAQRAAADRTRRRRRASRAEPVTDESTRGFVDEFAPLLTATGMPRMAARVFARLLTADTGGLTSAELVDVLRVSPASVSKSVGYLEAMDLVTRQPDSTGRRERYLIGDDIWLRAWQTDTGAHRRLAAAARVGVTAFGADTPAGARLARMGEFFGRLSEQMGDSQVAECVAYDALTVLAALVHAGRPLPVTTLAAALDWSPDRTTMAIATIHSKPALADPLALQETEPDTYTIAVRPDRLSVAQRAALG